MRASAEKSRNVVIRSLDHQVYIEKDVVGLVDSLHELRAEGNIIDEVAVHDVEVQPVSARANSSGAFLFQLAPVGSQ